MISVDAAPEHVISSASRDFDDALRRQRRATDIFRNLAESDSQNVQAWQSLAVSQLHRGDLARRSGRPDDGDADAAVSHYEEALRLLRSIRGIDPRNQRTTTLIRRAEQRLERMHALASRP